MAVPLLSPADPSNCLFCGASVTDRFRRVHGDNQNRAHRCYACDTKTRIKKGSAAGRELPYYRDPQDDPQKHHLVENLVPTDSDDNGGVA